MKDAEALFDKEKTWLYKSSYWTHSTRASFGSLSSNKHLVLWLMLNVRQVNHQM